MRQGTNKLYLYICLLCTVLFNSISSEASEFLKPDEAFQIKVDRLKNSSVQVQWDIAPGYKLYRKNIKFSSSLASLGEPILPPGERKYDENFGQEVETYHDHIAAIVPINTTTARFELIVKYQGCADEGLCYAPISKKFLIDSTSPESDQSLSKNDSAEVSEGEADPTAQVLESGNLVKIGSLFAFFGLLLSLTPCVLPMVPILSAIIVGDGASNKWRGFLLAGSYSLGMATIYTLLGIAAGLAGEGLAAAFQTPVVLMTFSLLMVVLSLTMFGVFELQLPNALQNRLLYISNKQTGGRVAGVFLMGAISALIIGPCVAAPLAGALVYISQTKDVVIGGWALFSMAVGMSIPLLLVGLSADAFLPRAGKWMTEVKHVFGLLLLASAIWIVNPLLDGWLLLAIWGAFCVLCAVFFHAMEDGKSQSSVIARFTKSVALLFLIVGVLELLGAASGGKDPLQPLGQLHLQRDQSQIAVNELEFHKINNMAQLNQVLSASAAPVMLDFYADWCISCKEMEKTTFRNEHVSNKLKNVVLMQVDVTKNSEEHRALLKRFNLYGPPGIVFFNRDGHEISSSRVIGYLDPQSFVAHLDKYLGQLL